MSPRSLSSWSLACMLVIFAQDATATFRFSDIQLIVGFSSGCTTSYQNSISNCNLNDLAGIGGSGSCSANCQSSIRSAQSAVQRACTRETADSNSLIGKIFVGEAVDFLCLPVVQTLTTTTTVPSARTTAASTNTETATTETTAARSTSSSSSQTETSSTDRSTATTESSASSSETSSSTLETTSSSRSTGTTTTTSAAASTTTARSNGGDADTGGGGSPFDPPFNSGAPTLEALQPYLLALTFVWALMVLL
ncbi:hypothetical protein LTR84_009970 [Exophiala bonariae]|uniref:Extracellular membrane protein CFEM domain-containing protein n=1 Tax=Exophiala bonariae TaxID=1690606 RepID=A0AAV9NNZ4_9EURO|nr:hypothetical protein LTR84_009970 [Exophiala bonariae]